MPDSFHGPSESFLEGQAAPGESTSWQEVILLFWVYPPKANTLSERPAAGETPLALLSLHQPSHSAPSTAFLPALTSFPISPHSHSSNPPGRLALTYSNILSVLLAFSILHLSDASLRSSHCFASWALPLGPSSPSPSSFLPLVVLTRCRLFFTLLFLLILISGTLHFLCYLFNLLFLKTSMLSSSFLMSPFSLLPTPFSVFCYFHAFFFCFLFLWRCGPFPPTSPGVWRPHPLLWPTEDHRNGDPMYGREFFLNWSSMHRC